MNHALYAHMNNKPKIKKKKKKKENVNQHMIKNGIMTLQAFSLQVHSVGLY
jgi:hypothetical protein